MADKLMYMHNDDTQNYPFCTLQLDTKLNEPTNKTNYSVNIAKYYTYPYYADR